MSSSINPVYLYLYTYKLVTKRTVCLESNLQFCLKWAFLGGGGGGVEKILPVLNVMMIAPRVGRSMQLAGTLSQ